VCFSKMILYNTYEADFLLFGVSLYHIVASVVVVVVVLVLVAAVVVVVVVVVVVLVLVTAACCCCCCCPQELFRPHLYKEADALKR